MHVNMKNHNTSRLFPGVKIEENFHTIRVTKKFFVTMATNTARKEHKKNQKKNYKRVKSKLMHTK